MLVTFGIWGRDVGFAFWDLGTRDLEYGVLRIGRQDGVLLGLVYGSLVVEGDGGGTIQC